MFFLSFFCDCCYAYVTCPTTTTTNGKLKKKESVGFYMLDIVVVVMYVHTRVHHHHHHHHHSHWQKSMNEMNFFFQQPETNVIVTSEKKPSIKLESEFFLF